VCCLKCGHLFGKSCIEKWLKTNSRCPQCNAAAKKGEIRVLFARKVVALDAKERNALLQKLDAERKEKLRAIECEARIREEYRALYSEYEACKAKAQQTAGCSLPEAAFAPSRFQSEVKVAGTADKCRFLGVETTKNLLVVSRSNQQLSGLVKLNLYDLSVSEFIPLHSKPIRSLAVSPFNDQLVMTCGFDKSLKLTNVNSNCAVISIKSEFPLWCSVFHTDDKNQIYYADARGSLFHSDLRRFEQPVKCYSVHLDRQAPIHSLFHWQQEGRSCLIGADLSKSFRLDLDSEVASDFSELESCTGLFKSSSKALFLSLHRHDTQRSIQIHTASSIEALHPRYSTADLSIHPSMYRCAIYSQNESDYALIPHQTTHSVLLIYLQVQLYSIGQLHLQQESSLPTNRASPIMDVAIISQKEDRKVGVLNEQQLFIYSNQNA
jgi:hypothetical protein